MKMTAIALLATIGCTALAMDRPATEEKADNAPSFTPDKVRRIAQEVGRKVTSDFIEILEKENDENEENTKKLVEELNELLFKTDSSEETLTSVVTEYPRLHKWILSDVSDIEHEKRSANQDDEDIFNPEFYKSFGQMTLIAHRIKKEQAKIDELSLLNLLAESAKKQGGNIATRN